MGQARYDGDMLRTLLKSQIHRVLTAHCGLHFEGSCTIDENLPNAASICLRRLCLSMGQMSIHVVQTNHV